MELRILPSDKQFPTVSFLTEWIARLKNPQVWYDLRGMADAERLADLAALESLFEELTH